MYAFAFVCDYTTGLLTDYKYYFTYYFWHGIVQMKMPAKEMTIYKNFKHVGYKQSKINAVGYEKSTFDRSMISPNTSEGCSEAAVNSSMYVDQF